ncbi:MAG: hypothetical protein DME59_10495 [Verrucomicrobia bacterium]|nr:MAG: hypothetical protein DME59_10495 [Verrucomicrobiota bacterium]
MPKKTKTAEDTNQPSPESAAPAATKKTGKRQTPRRATATKKPRKPKVTSERTAHISASPQADGAPMSGEPSEDAVRLRAYFISERRRRFALPGDAESDWLEAKRQLLAETRR